ncbi:RPII140-upstream gene protein [Leptopilina heterotoma]|uniref:RPII140-upstream gene protein n=1 Tax=Leptopilina heterotoma TaxID=63436 RepID=UPI001CA838B9|nr:RPII140-upstream gene protein [Leptopilina heterotoma]
MTFILTRSSLYALAALPFYNSGNALDIPSDDTYVEKPKPTTKMERFQNIFYKDEYGNLSPELQYCVHLTSMGLVIGGFYGGLINGRTAFFKFIDNNQATMFQNHLDAKRRLQDILSYNLLKGGAQWAWRTALFTSLYGITSTSVAVVRGKSGIIEHTDGGLVAGALYNMKNGFRGVIVGGGLGAVLGTIFGTLAFVILTLSGKTMEDVKFYTVQWRDHREGLFFKADRKKRLEKEEQEIMKTLKDLTGKEATS